MIVLSAEAVANRWLCGSNATEYTFPPCSPIVRSIFVWTSQTFTCFLAAAMAKSWPSAEKSRQHISPLASLRFRIVKFKFVDLLVRFPIPKRDVAFGVNRGDHIPSRCEGCRIDGMIMWQSTELLLLRGLPSSDTTVARCGHEQITFVAELDTANSTLVAEEVSVTTLVEPAVQVPFESSILGGYSLQPGNGIENAIPCPPCSQ